MFSFFITKVQILILPLIVTIELSKIFKSYYMIYYKIKVVIYKLLGQMDTLPLFFFFFSFFSLCNVVHIITTHNCSKRNSILIIVIVVYIISYNIIKKVCFRSYGCTKWIFYICDKWLHSTHTKWLFSIYIATLSLCKSATFN